MKSLKLSFIAILTFFVTHLQADPVLQKLTGINAEWASHPDAAIAPGDHLFNTDEEWIQYHLLLVHRDLSKKDVSHLGKVERKNRRESLEELLEYALRGEFPRNISHRGRRPVFIDDRGVHCAVGYLIMRSGNDELSNRISENMNFHYLKQMQDDGLFAWVEQSGFTLDELAWIQPGYFQPIDYQPLKGGVNGRVNTIISDNNTGLYVGGSFDTADQSAVGNLANYFSGIAGYDWMKIGATGLNGEVHDVITYKGELYVAGEFFNADTVYTNSGVVKWDGTQWQAVGDFYIGALVNYVLDLEIYRDTLYAGGFFRAKAGVPKHFESVAKWDGTDWVHAGVDLMGTVHKLHVHNNKLVIGGNFQMNTGAFIRNICRLNGNQVEFFGEDISIPVNDLASVSNELFAATDFVIPGSPDTLGLISYQNGSWDVLFDNSYSGTQSWGGVKALATYNDVLFLGGDFVVLSLIGNYGENMAYYRDGHLSAFGMLDSTVHALTVINDNLYLGGDFTSSGMAVPPIGVNHIAEVYLPKYVGIQEEVKPEAALYPVPASSMITLERNGQMWKDFKITDMSGKAFPVRVTEDNRGFHLEVSHLKSGAYILTASDGQAKLERRVIIE